MCPLYDGTSSKVQISAKGLMWILKENRLIEDTKDMTVEAVLSFYKLLACQLSFYRSFQKRDLL